MAYDEALANAFRSRIAGIEGVSERKMMGGVCFFLGGNMLGGADRQASGAGRFMFRVGKPNDAVAAVLPGGAPIVQGGRRLTGMYFVDEDECTDDVFRQWLSLALSYASTLPEKPPAPPKPRKPSRARTRAANR